MVGKIISHYKILKKLGEGGMGEVYLAEDLKLKRNVALKFLSRHAVADEEEKTRFIREAQAAASLNHPNICTVYEIDERDNHTYIAMEYIAGDNLTEKIKKGSFSLNDSINIILQLAEGLKAASEKGIVHRDIKSSNILFTDEDKPKITDFGLAKLKGSKYVTKPGTTLGTPSYMSPEQALGKDLDRRTDIWSLGVVFYEMLSGQLPFKGDADQAIIYSIINEDPTPIDEYVSKIPTTLKNIITKMVAKDVTKRYQNFDDVINDIEKFAANADIKLKTRTTFNQKQRRNRTLKIGAAFITLAALIILLFVVIEKPVDKVNIRLIVMPFKNLGSPAEDYFSDGVYEETVNRLSYLNGLVIVPRIKTLKYVKDKNIETMRNELDIDYMLEGSVLWDKGDQSNKIRIITNLVDAGNETLVWSEKYDGKFDDVFKIQTDIAEMVAKHLDIEILAPEREALAAPSTTNMEAYEFVLRAREIMRPAQSLPREERIQRYLEANKMYDRAIALDSNYYSAYLNLSHNSSFLYFYGYDRTDERKNQTRHIIEKILEMNPDDPGARSQLAIYYYRMEYDYKRCYDLLTELRKEYPNYSTLWLGIVERRLGMWRQATQHISEAEELSPYNDDTPLILGEIYTFLRKYDLADKAYDRSIKNHPAFLYAVRDKVKNYISWNGDLNSARSAWKIIPDGGKTDITWLNIYRLEKNYDEMINLLHIQKENIIDMEGIYFFRYNEYALTYYLNKKPAMTKTYADSALVFLKSIQAEKPGDPSFHDGLGIAYALLGDKEKALYNGLRSVELCPVTYDAINGTYHLLNLAKIYTILGENEKAIEQLKYLLSVPSEVSTAYLKLDPLWDDLRDHPEFKTLVEE